MITKQEALKELAQRELARRKLEYFTTYVDPFFWHPNKWYVFKPFHKQITDALEKVLSWEIKKLMISVPPQHWKSTISSQRFPLFAHTKDKYLNIWLASYSADLSATQLAKARQIIDSEQFKNLFKDFELIKDTSNEYITKEWGWLVAVWVWWPLTWKPIDLGIIDDVHKDRAEYESPTIRNKVWDWYTSVFLSRLHKDSKQVLVMTRWGEDDLFWRILELEWEEWTVINIPVEFEDTTIFPERFPLDFIQQKRKVMWERDYQSLYMWDPINEWGWDFKREYFEYYEWLEIEARYNRLDIISFLDPAISKTQTADNTAIVTIWTDSSSNLVYLLEVKKLKEQPDEIINEVFLTTDKFNGKWRSYKFWIEVVQYQKMLSLEISKQMRLRDKFFLLEEVRPQGEKEARIRTALQARYSNHSIIHPRYAPNISDLETELLKFPNGKNDDMIDALSSAIMLGSVNNLANNNVSDIITVDYDDLL